MSINLGDNAEYGTPPTTEQSDIIKGALSLGNVEDVALSTWTGSENLSLSASQIVDFNSSASDASPVQSVAGKTGVVSLSSSDVSGLVDVVTSANVAAVLPAAITEAGASEVRASLGTEAINACPRASATFAAIANRGITPPSSGYVSQATMLGIGDSTGDKVFSDLVAYAEAEFGINGYALEYLFYKTISGTVANKATGSVTTAQGELTEHGNVRTLSDGAVVNIGENYASTTAVPLEANRASVYLGTRPGNGDAVLESSLDNGANWVALETFDCDLALGVVARTFTLTDAKKYLIRVTASGGQVELIGAKMWNTKKRGVIVAGVNLDGMEIHQAIARSTPDRRLAVFGDIDPDFVMIQFAEDYADWTLPNFQSFATLWEDSCPRADFLWLNHNYRWNRVDSEVDEINAGIAQVAITHSRFFVFDLAQHFKTGDYLNESGLSDVDGDQTHFTWDDGAAWRSVTPRIAKMLSMTTNPGKPTWRPYFKDGGNLRYNLTLRDDNRSNAFRIRRGQDASLTYSIGPDTEGSVDTFGQSFTFLAGNATKNPGGFQLRANDPAVSLLTHTWIDTHGCYKFATINTGSTDTAYDEGTRISVSSYNQNYAALKLVGSSVQAVNVFEVKSKSADVMAVNKDGRVQSAAGFAHGFAGTGPSWTVGSGSPEGVVSAPIGSLYSNTSGGASTTLYVKESGTGNTGWKAALIAS